MKIILLGSTGQLGTDLSALLKRQSAIDLVSLTKAQLDLTDFGQILTGLSEIHFDCLINCTAYNRVDDAEEKISEAFALNGKAVGYLAQACALKKAVFIQVSTDYVFSGDKKESYTEEDTPSPINIYGASKHYGETQALFYNPKTFILRVASLFGVAGSSGKGGNFVETIIAKAKEKGELRVVNDITMSPTHTQDVAEVILKLIQNQMNPGIYHLVNAGQASWYDFAKEIISLSGLKANVIPIQSSEFQTKARRPALSVLDNKKIVQALGEISNWQKALKNYLHQKGYL